MCDNCRHPKEKVEASAELLDVIAAVNQTHGKFKTSEIINILRGKSSAVLVKNDATSLPTWGIQKDKSEAHLRAVIRQGIIRHYLNKNIDAYGTIQVTEKGNAGKLPKAFRVRKELDYDVLNSRNSAPTKVVALTSSSLAYLKIYVKKWQFQRRSPLCCFQ